MYSSQTAKSDGTLERLNLSLAYISKDDIFVTVDDVLLPTPEYSWTWVGNDVIQFNKPIANDSIVNVRRVTPLDRMRHVFAVGGAIFKDKSVDENFRQLLYQVQEFSEGSVLTDLWNDLNMHGFRVRNMGIPTDSRDAITLGWYQADKQGTWEAYQRSILEANKSATSANAAKAYLNTLQGAILDAETALATANNANANANTAKVEAHEALVIAQALERSNLIQLDSIQALREFSPITVDTVVVTSYYANSGVGGGLFIRDPLDTTSNDNSYSIIVGADGQRFKRVLRGTLTLHEFGCVGDGVTDDTVAFQRALSYKDISVPVGSYILNGTFVINNDLTIRGQGGVLLPSIKGNFLQATVATTSQLSLLDVIIDGHRYAGKLDDDMGMSLVAGHVSHHFKAIGCTLLNTYGSGFNCASSGVSTIIGNTISNVFGYNLTKDPSGAYDNYGDGIRASRSLSGVIMGNYIVNDGATNGLGRAGIVLEFNGDNITCQGNYIRGYDRGIHAEFANGAYIVSNNIDKCGLCVITVNASGAVIQGNTLVSSTKYTDTLFSKYAVLYDYLGNSMTITDNIIRSTTTLPAILANGNNRDKFTLERNQITGSVSVIAGSVTSVIRNNLFTNTTFNTVSFVGNHKMLENMFHNTQLSGLNSGAVIRGNIFRNFANNPLSLMNPRNITVEDNTFIAPLNYSSYMIDNYSGVDNGLNKFNGNVIDISNIVTILPSMFRHSAAAHTPYVVERLNSMTDGNFSVGIEVLNASGTGGLIRNKSITTATVNDGLWYGRGDRLSNLSSGLLFSKLCTSSGIATENSWTASTGVTRGTMLYQGTSVYYVVTAGTTGSTAPTHNSGTANNGTASLKYVGTKAVFKDV